MSPPKEILPMNGRVLPKNLPIVSFREGRVENRRVNTVSTRATGARPVRQRSAIGSDTITFRGNNAAADSTSKLNQSEAWSVSQLLVGVNSIFNLRQTSCFRTESIRTTSSIANNMNRKNRAANWSGRKLRFVRIASPASTTATHTLFHRKINHEPKKPSSQAAPSSSMMNGNRSVLMPPPTAASYQTSKRSESSRIRSPRDSPSTVDEAFQMM